PTIRLAHRKPATHQVRRNLPPSYQRHQRHQQDPSLPFTARIMASKPSQGYTRETTYFTVRSQNLVSRTSISNKATYFVPNAFPWKSIKEWEADYAKRATTTR
ncbi:MAG TPA: hypothetical protein VMU62_08895, partial [Acidobacteriaceae bacterium]|nr:hypothetical protein [Acidobacteriaceae bacterium]